MQCNAAGVVFEQLESLTPFLSLACREDNATSD